MKLYIDQLQLSPYTYSVLAALHEKKMKCEVIHVKFVGGECFDPEFKKISTTGLIPLLVDGDLKLSESLAILEYLEDKVPEPSIFPKSIQDRAYARMLLNWYRCAMTGLRSERSTETVFYTEKRTTKPLSASTEEEVKELITFLKGLFKPGAKYLFGNQWTIADHETALMLQRLIQNGDFIEPALKDYANRVWEHPAAKAWVNFQRPPHVSYY